MTRQRADFIAELSETIAQIRRGHPVRVAIDHAVKAMLLEPLGPSGNRRYRTAKFDYRADLPIMSPLRYAREDAVLLCDGVFLHRPELAGMWDLTIFLDVSFEEAERRCRTRDGSVASPPESVDRYAGGQALYLRLRRPKESADIVVHYDNLSAPSIASRIRKIRDERRHGGG